jgi:hypothetical protein
MIPSLDSLNLDGLRASNNSVTSGLLATGSTASTSGQPSSAKQALGDFATVVAVAVAVAAAARGRPLGLAILGPLVVNMVYNDAFMRAERMAARRDAQAEAKQAVDRMSKDFGNQNLKEARDHVPVGLGRGEKGA